METTEKAHFMDNVINGLRKAAVELEDFQVQLALGQAVAFEKYQEVKKKFQEFVHESLNKLREDKISAQELKMKFHLMEQLLEKDTIETKEEFIAQKKKIISLIEEIETSMKNTTMDKEFHFIINNEIEKFKIKMEILRLRFELGKLDAKKEFESIKMDFSKKVDQMKEKFSEGESALSKNWNHFSDELSEAYKHLKKAFILSE